MIRYESLREELGEEVAQKVEKPVNAVPIVEEDNKKFYQKPIFWIVVVGGLAIGAYAIIKRKKGNAASIGDIQ